SDALFEQLDFDKLKDELNVEMLAKQQAMSGKPPSESVSLDANEQKITNYFSETLSQVKQEIFKKVASYEHMAMRVNDITTSLTEAKYASEEFLQNITTFKESAKQRIRDLRHELNIKKNDLRNFKIANALSREASYPSSKMLYIGIIMLILLSETMLNAYFFAKGNELGLIGGAAQALIISVINMTLAFFLGSFLVKRLNLLTISTISKYSVVAALIFSALLILFFNLLVGHLRVQLGIDPANAYVNAILSFQENPFGLYEFDSLILVLVGILSFLIAFTDFYKMDDEYPAYGELDRKYQETLADYTELKEELLNKIERMSDSILNKLETRQMTSRVIMQELTEIPIFRQKLYDHYNEYYHYLNNTYNAMLNLYRETNREYRSDEAPVYFNQRAELDSGFAIKILDPKFKKELRHYQEAVLELPHIIGEQKLKINATLKEVISELGKISETETDDA
ncbi:MAG: hypothetical protein MUP09_07305, partial [Thiovulaceae bacterium]|nr:hypothetical protein [Sulfurimonadaceae bacterium]